MPVEYSAVMNENAEHADRELGQLCACEGYIERVEVRAIVCLHVRPVVDDHRRSERADAHVSKNATAERPTVERTDRSFVHSERIRGPV